jgi:hypothetical protein
VSANRWGGLINPVKCVEISLGTGAQPFCESRTLLSDSVMAARRPLNLYFKSSLQNKPNSIDLTFQQGSAGSATKLTGGEEY